MKIVKALRGLYIPSNPETPDMRSLRLIPRGTLAVIPDDFKLPEGSYEDVNDLSGLSEKKVKETKEHKKSKKEKEADAEDGGF